MTLCEITGGADIKNRRVFVAVAETAARAAPETVHALRVTFTEKGATRVAITLEHDSLGDVTLTVGATVHEAQVFLHALTMAWNLPR